MRANIINFIVVMLSFLSAIICIFSMRDVSVGYEIMWIQPLTFALTYLLILMPIIKINRFKITVYTYIFLAWLRMVIIPLFSAITGVYNGVTYIEVSQNSIHLAIWLVVWELVISSIFLYLVTISKSNERFVYAPKIKLELKGNKIVYFLFIFLSVVLYLTIGRNLNIINFFIISTNSSEQFTDITATPLILLRQIFKCSLIFFFVWYTSYCKKKYDKSSNNKYLYYAMLVGILNVGVIVGERRSEQIYTSLVVIFILSNAFKKYRKKIIIFITLTAVFVLLFMSIYKHFSAFYYGSYFNALQSSTLNLEWLTLTLQSYFFGTQNVAAVIQFKDSVDLNITNMLYDFGRSIFGLSFLLKNKMIMTTEYFNTFIYGTNRPNGHVISAIGYGYVYLGAVFSPLIVCINIFIATKLETWLNKTNSYEMKYIYGYMLVRFATNIFVNTPPLLSLATIMYFTAGLVYFVARLFRNKEGSAIYIEELSIKSSVEEVSDY